MTKLKSCGRLLFISITFTSLLFAKKHEVVPHAPLPAKVLAAKTIYLQNDSGLADMGDKAYAQLKTWGKYQIVDSKEKADLILLLAMGNINTETTEPEHLSTYNYKTGERTSGTVQAPSTRTWMFTAMKLIDQSTGDTLWADKLEWRRKYSATERLVQSLRQRVEEQEKEASSPNKQ